MGKLRLGIAFAVVVITVSSFLITKVFAAAGQWSSNGTTIFYNDGKVGLGTNEPSSILDITGNNSDINIDTLRLATYPNRHWLFTNGKYDVNPNSQNGSYSLQIAQPIYTGCEACKGDLRFKPGRNTIFAQGNVGIGTSLIPSNKLEVNGTIKAKQVIVTSSGWADYVFSPDYKLKDLSEVEKFIEANKHLPNIPSQAEVDKNGIALGDMQKLQMEKIEELTLYVIQLQKEINELKK